MAQQSFSESSKTAQTDGHADASQFTSEQEEHSAKDLRQLLISGRSGHWGTFGCASRSRASLKGGWDGTLPAGDLTMPEWSCTYCWGTWPLIPTPPREMEWIADWRGARRSSGWRFQRKRAIKKAAPARMQNRDKACSLDITAQPLRSLPMLIGRLINSTLIFRCGSIFSALITIIMEQGQSICIA